MIWFLLIAIVIFSVVVRQQMYCAICNNSATLYRLPNRKSGKLFYKPSYGVIAFFIILACISGLRYEIGGSDYFVYKTVFDSIPRINIFFHNFSSLRTDYITYGHEVGWLFIMSLIKSLGLNYNGFLFVVSAFFYFCFYKLVKCFNVNTYLVILFFLYTTFFYNTMISIRQGTTIAIFMLMVICLFKRKFKSYFVIYLITCFIHTAAVVLILPLFVFNLHTSKSMLNKLFFVAIFLLALAQLHVNILYPLNFLTPLVNSIFGETVALKFVDLIGSADAGNISILHSLQFLFFMGLISYYHKSIYENRISAGIANIILLLYIPLIILPHYSILTRIKDYFTVFYGILLAIILRIEKSSSNRLALILLSVLICTAGYFKYIIEFDDGHFWSYTIISLMRG